MNRDKPGRREQNIVRTSIILFSILKYCSLLFVSSPSSFTIPIMLHLTVGVLALQGGFSEHLDLLRTAATSLAATGQISPSAISLIEVRTKEDLDQCGGLIIPGGESTTISFVAAQSGLLEPLRDFVK